MDDVVDIKCTHAIPVGEKDGPRPVVHGIAWNPSPEACSQDTTAMLACVSSKGVSIYSLKKNKRKWTSLEIEHRPSSEAKVLAWHSEGRVLATASSALGGKLSILAYDGEDGFTAKTALQCPEGETITSLCWAGMSTSLVLALYPSLALCFLRVKDGNPENLENLGLVKYADHFARTSPIMLASDPSGGALFAYCHNKLLQFRDSAAHQLPFKLHNALTAPVGIRAIVFDDTDCGLFTIEEDKWTYWLIEDSNNLVQVATMSNNEKTRRKGGEYTSIAVSSSGKFVATGGSDNLCCYLKETDEDNVIEVKFQGCRTRHVNWGVVTCLAFHPMEDRTKLIALGGDTGYLYVWAVVLRGSMKTKYTELDRTDEFYNKYYSRSFADADKKDDKWVVSDLNYPSIVLKLEDMINAEGAVSESASGSRSDAAAAAGSQSAAAVAADIVGDPSGNTLADKLACVNKETIEQILRRYVDLNDIANQAVSNIMSLGALADDMLSRRNQLTADEVTKFLEKVSSAQRNKV